jgi:hypothetical protein
MSLSTASHFALTFGRAAWHGVEYSIDDDPRRRATTVAGGADFSGRVRNFASELPFAAVWMWAVDRFVEQVRPDSYLLRVDWQGETPLAVTIYCHFPIEPDTRTFAAAIRAAHPIAWTGPDAGAIAAALGVRGPRGVGLRVIATGSCSAAVYFRVPETRHVDGVRALSALSELLRFPAALTEGIHEDLRGLSYTSGGVVGVGPDENEHVCLKLNPPNVATARALAFLTAKGAPLARLDAINDLAISLRAESLSYLGVRYDAEGFKGWRAYFSLDSYRVAVPLQPRITVERGATPTLRLPHD